MSDIRKEPTYALESELGYIKRSISWTCGRAGVEGTSVGDLSGPLAREKAIEQELERRKKKQ